MRKTPDPSSDSKFYKGICLYRDEIDHILSILQEKGYEIKITDKEFEYNSLDDLIEKRGVTPRYFKIEGKGRGHTYEWPLSIIFDKESIHINSSNLSNQADFNIYIKASDVCSSHYSKLYKILNPWTYLYPLILGIYLERSVFKITGTELQVYLALLIIGVTALIISIIYRERRHQVILVRRHIGGFWKQNSDKIWLLIIGALIGGFSKTIIDMILKKMTL